MSAPSRIPGPPPSAHWPIWGHQQIVEDLRGAIAADRVRHAYLFAGPDGVGKTAIATAFAQTLCCQQSPEPGVPCGECLACRKIARGVHPDVQTVSLATQAATAEKAGGKNTSLTIDTVRSLCSAVTLRPMEGRWRVMLVEDAETLQETAQEALLKTLEEPPGFMVLILLTNDTERLLPTIRSRCQLAELRPVDRASIVDGLQATGVTIDLADELAALAAGCPGWALRAARDNRLFAKRREAVERVVEWIDGSGYDRMVRAVRVGDTFSKRRGEIFADLETLLGVWRDILLLRASLPHYLTYRGYAERLIDLARGWAMADVHRALRSVQTCIADLEANVRPRLAMEAMVLQWPTSQVPD